MESIAVSVRSYHEKSAGFLSETSFWARGLSNMPRLAQELISKYFMEEMVFVEIQSKEKLNLNPKVTNFLKNNI